MPWIVAVIGLTFVPFFMFTPRLSRSWFRPSQYWLLVLSLTGSGCVVSQAQPTPASTTPASTTTALTTTALTTVITSFDAPFLFAYGTWERVAKVEAGHLVLDTPTAQGGLGSNIRPALDLSAQGENSPALRLKIGPNNKLTTLRLLLADSKGGNSTWNFSLVGQPVGQEVVVTPVEGASLSKASTLGDQGGANLADVVQWQVQGDWSRGPVDVSLDSVELVAPDEAIRAARTQADTRRAEEAEKLRQDQAALKAKYPRSNQSPVVDHIAPVAPDVLALEIQAGHVLPASLQKYVPQPGDTKKEKRDDKGVVTEVRLVRGGQEVGWLLGSQRNWLTTREGFEGDPLLEFEADKLSNFLVSSPDDAAFGQNVTPLAVARKSKPGNWAQESSDFEIRHTLYLRLPRPLQTGKHYLVHLGELNTRQTQVEFFNQPSQVRSEAVHVNQIGYRSDDLGKRAFVSCWMGNGGALKLPSTIRFSLVNDQSGQVVYSGQSSDLWPADKVEHQQRDANFSGTDVMRLDFSDFKTPGRYRLVAAGFGSSYPFDIGPSTWTRALLTQMHGLYNQRSGVVLGPPYTPFKRPRPMFPGDEDVKITQSTYRNVDGGDAYQGLAQGDTGVPVPQAWGGYHDAGDWNPRRVTHMKVTLASLQLLDLFPQKLGALKLNIPPLPNKPQVPDVLNEAIFEFECFHRLQTPEGGVSFGIETNGDPYLGEVSWLQSMPLYVYAPDYDASWYYAAVGARLSYLLQKSDPKLAATYRQSAIKAFNWGVQDFQRDPKAAERNTTWQGADSRDSRSLAALELYRLTRDPQWHAAFLASNKENGTPTPNQEVKFAGVSTTAHDIAFLYARLPLGLGNAAIKQQAVQAITGWADQALAYADENAWNLTTSDKGKPQFIGFYSGPDATDLTYAHFLTRQAKYLAGAVRATGFGAGANPINMVYTSGLGANPVQHPFNLDARRTGQAVPIGLTPYGNVDFGKWGDQQWITWPITYFLNKNTTPNPLTWPTNEAYWDTGGWPALNEFTVDAWTPNVAVWGYLALRN